MAILYCLNEAVTLNDGSNDGSNVNLNVGSCVGSDDIVPSFVCGIQCRFNIRMVQKHLIQPYTMGKKQTDRLNSYRLYVHRLYVCVAGIGAVEKFSY